MADLQAIKEKRGKLAKKIEEFRDKFHANGKKWADDAERSAYEQINNDYDAVAEEFRMAQVEFDVDARLKEVKDIEERTDHRGRKPGMDDFDSRQDRERIEERERQRQGNDRRQKLPDEERRSLALAGFCRMQMGHMVTDDHIAAMGECRMQPHMRELRFGHPDTKELRALQSEWNARSPATANLVDSIIESRALSGTTLGIGGVLIPDSFIRRLEINMFAWGGMLAAGTIITTATGEEMTLPTMDDSANTGRRIGETPTVATTGKDPAFGGVTWSSFGYTTDAVLVPYNFLEDSFTDLGALLAEAFGIRNGRKMNLDFTTGADASGPAGLLTKAALGITTANAASIIYDDVVQLRFSVDPAYRAGGSYMCHDTIMMALRLVKDTTNVPLWCSGVQLGGPDTIDGYKAYVNMDMASTIAAGNKTMTFGQHGKYKIRKVGARRFYRLQELYRANDQDGFILFERADGNLETASATNTPVKYMLQHA